MPLEDDPACLPCSAKITPGKPLRSTGIEKHSIFSFTFRIPSAMRPLTASRQRQLPEVSWALSALPASPELEVVLQGAKVSAPARTGCQPERRCKARLRSAALPEFDLSCAGQPMGVPLSVSKRNSHSPKGPPTTQYGRHELVVFRERPAPPAVSLQHASNPSTTAAQPGTLGPGLPARLG